LIHTSAEDAEERQGSIYAPESVETLSGSSNGFDSTCVKVLYAIETRPCKFDFSASSAISAVNDHVEVAMKHKVLIMKCDNYDPKRIAGIVKEGMAELAVTPHGRTMLKPNCVLAHKELFPHAYTREEFLEGVIMAMKESGTDIRELSVGERSGITIPTRFCFKKAGYQEVMKRHGVKAYYFDEVRQVPVDLKRPEHLRDLIFIPKPVAETDFLVNLPKFKAHPWTRLTLALKNYIGIQDDRHRLLDHNAYLEHKIADLQDAKPSSFIAVDGIIAGQKMMLTPSPFPMGAIVMGANACAVDTVCCHMVNVDPAEVLHLKYASQRGLGPMDLGEIQVDGDFPLAAVQEKTRSFEFCFERIDNYFHPTRGIECTVGKFPEEHSSDYCWGGCPGALQEAMHIYRQYYPDVDERMGKLRLVMGEVEGPLNLQDDEKVVFVGDCCKWEGNIDGKKVVISGQYKNPLSMHARKTKSNDMIVKIMWALMHSTANRWSRYIHAKGCPVSVGQHVNYISAFAKLPNVNFDRRMVVAVNVAYWQMRFKRFLSRLFG
jgi:uncharacterized protein (DUF362 family)